MATAHALSEFEKLILTPKRNHVPVTEVGVVFCPVCKVGNRIIEGQRCGVCEKLKEG